VIPVWGLVDDRTGHTGQVLGVIGKLGMPYLLKRLEYNWKIHLPNRLLGASSAALDARSRARIAPPWPKLVIAAGRRTIPVARYIKKKSPTTVLVYLMWPGHAKGFDLVAIPQHDGPRHGANIVTTLAPLHAVTPETLTAARDVWLPYFHHLPRPQVAVMIGGNTRHHAFTGEDWVQLILRARDLAGAGSLLVTTSRRTPPAALTIIAPMLEGTPHLLHRWDSGKDNPYLGLLSCADAMIVTGDSLSMCAEVCVSGKPVYIFAPAHTVSDKHRRLHEALYRSGQARPADDKMTLHWNPTEPLDDAGLVAGALKTRFPQITN